MGEEVGVGEAGAARAPLPDGLCAPGAALPAAKAAALVGGLPAAAVPVLARRVRQGPAIGTVAPASGLPLPLLAGAAADAAAGPVTKDPKGARQLPRPPVAVPHPRRLPFPLPPVRDGADLGATPRVDADPPH